MDIREIQEYELLKEKALSDIQSNGYFLKHKKSGAVVLLLENDDDNKVFNITFRTPPQDSTGLPHILEHSVLCGSKKYPLKDPFVELVKGSMNTFLNAMTYPDKTMYPIASRNSQDFANLMSVYMDAVFFTNIYEKEEIFRQEGWSYALESAEAPLTYNGVVYNEMKGAFSSPEGVLEREILNSLNPDNSYANESGGDPQYIPDLKYSSFLSFHSKYYHPSNCYICLYGDMDMAEKLKWMDREYLSKYDEIPVVSEIVPQKPFKKPVELIKKYSISEAEKLEDNTYLSYNISAGTSLDVQTNIAFQVLEYALISAPGAPLKKALLDAKVGKDISGSFENSVYQPFFSIIAKNANFEDKERFVNIIRQTLHDIVKVGVNKKSILAGINSMEFKYREADYGRFPKGLMYCIEAFNSWLYDKNQPFVYMEQLKVYEFLKGQADTGYFEELIQNYLLDNPHASIVIVEPEKGLTAKIDKATAEKLQKYKESLSEAEVKRLVENTKKLTAYQETISTKEELECLPMLERSDLKRETASVYNTEYNMDGVKVLHHDIFTNGIGYLKLLFDTEHVPEHLIPYMGILRSVLGYVDTSLYSYSELFNEINMYTGGISTTLNVYSNVKKPQTYKMMYEVHAKALYEKMDFVFEMAEEILLTSKFEDEQRLYEIIAQMKSRMQMQLNTNGHASSAARAQSYFSKAAKLTDMTSGIELYKLVEDIEKNFQSRKAELIENLKSLMNCIFTKENMMVSFTSDNEGLKLLGSGISAISSKLYFSKANDIKDLHQKRRLDVERKNEGFMTSSKIQYVARAGNFLAKGYPYTGVLKILKVMLSYDYLWSNVRVKGGAYGCMCGFNKIGDSFFVSYRDPNLEKTNKVYEGIPDYIRNLEIDERDITKYIIGTLSDLDMPQSPAGKGAYSLAVYMTGQTLEDLQIERDEILNADKEDIIRLAEYVDATLEGDYFCVIGNEEKIKEQKELFNILLPLVE